MQWHLRVLSRRDETIAPSRNRSTTYQRDRQSLEIRRTWIGQLEELQEVLGKTALDQAFRVPGCSWAAWLEIP